MSGAHNKTNEALGNPVSTENKVLETGSSLLQDFGPVKEICAHLNAFHVYASDKSRCVESNHYCSHLNEDIRQCLIYDSPLPNARLIGVEYMISPDLFATLSADERKLWHSHVFEVKSGQLIMPGPRGVPTQVWDAAEQKEMEQVVHLYGKTYHLWQVDRGDKVPLGEAQLMLSISEENKVQPQFREAWKSRDERFGVSSEDKKKKREHIQEPKLQEGADALWNE